MFATVTNVVKNFACGGFFSFLYFNFVHDFIHYLCANCDKCCKKCRLRRAFGNHILQFRQLFAPKKLFLPTPLLEIVLFSYMNPQGVPNVLTPPGVFKK